MQRLNLRRNVEAPEHSGLEAAIARARELAHLIDSATAELAAIKAALVADAAARRIPGESSVRYAAPVKSARVTWTRRYKDVPEEELGKLVSDGLEDLFAECISLKLKAKADQTELASALVLAGIEPRLYFEVSAVRRFVGNPDDPRAQEVLAQIQAAPSVYL